MNKIGYCLITVAALFVVASCASQTHQQPPQNQTAGHGKHRPFVHTPVVTDPFRLPMQTRWADQYPPTPTPPPNPSGQQYWYDVSDWQAFLQSKTFLTPGSYLVGTFDSPTALATKNFQLSLLWGGMIANDGIVGINTYNKAITAGMPHYPTFGDSLRKHH